MKQKRFCFQVLDESNNVVIFVLYKLITVETQKSSVLQVDFIGG